MRRPRNNIAKLSWDSRSIICELLFDGAEYDTIRNDADVAAECAEKGLTLHGTTFQAYREGAEYLEYARRRRQWDDDFKRRQVAAQMLDDCGSADHLAKVANYEILKNCVELLESGDLETKDLKSLSGAVASFTRERLNAAKDEARREFEEQKAAYQAEIAKLSATIQQLTSSSKKVDSKQVAEKLDQALGVR
jgi:DNA-binding ferritin-like protein (Dps family)